MVRGPAGPLRHRPWPNTGPPHWETSRRAGCWRALLGRAASLPVARRLLRDSARSAERGELATAGKGLRAPGLLRSNSGRGPLSLPRSSVSVSRRFRAPAVRLPFARRRDRRPTRRDRSHIRTKRRCARPFEASQLLSRVAWRRSAAGRAPTPCEREVGATTLLEEAASPDL